MAKGPSYFPGDKRLAIQVEDHPLDYGGFEGIIPRGQYGGGTVMLWDQGWWEPVGDSDAAEGLRKGNLKFVLHGEKLRGQWVLVRMAGKFANQSKPSWLLIKERDGEEHAANDVPVTDEEPNSVLSRRSIDAIAKARDAVWDSNASPPASQSNHRNASRRTKKIDAVRLPKASKSSSLADLAPHLAHLSREAAKSTGQSKPARRHTSTANLASLNPSPMRLTHPDKVLDSGSGITKQGLADYYDAVAPHMLPHIGGRPLSLVRCMNGTSKPCFFQKHVNETLPPDIESVDIVDKKSVKPEPYITLSTSQALVELAQLSVLEIHSWGSKNDSLEKPDRIVITTLILTWQLVGKRSHPLLSKSASA